MTSSTQFLRLRREVQKSGLKVKMRSCFRWRFSPPELSCQIISCPASRARSPRREAQGLSYLVGPMWERGGGGGGGGGGGFNESRLVADEMAPRRGVISFGTNDLTQTTLV